MKKEYCRHCGKPRYDYEALSEARADIIRPFEILKAEMDLTNFEEVYDALKKKHKDNPKMLKAISYTHTWACETVNAQIEGLENGTYTDYTRLIELLEHHAQNP